MLLIISPIISSFLYGFIGNIISTEDPSGLEFLVTVLVWIFVIPTMLMTGLVTYIVTKKSPNNHYYSLMALGIFSVPTTLFMLVGMIVVALWPDF